MRSRQSRRWDRPRAICWRIGHAGSWSRSSRATATSAGQKGRTPAPGGETRTMLLRHRPPRIDDTRPATTRKGFEHLDERSIAVLQWLRANRIDFVLVGAVAEAVRGSTDARGPVSIVPAPYGRNFERLSRALGAA